MLSNKWQLGDIIKIDLTNEVCAFGRVLENPIMAFYDFFTKDVPDLNTILHKKIIFKIWVENKTIPKEWEKIGNLPLEKKLLEKPKFYKVDIVNKEKVFIYSEDGNDIPVSLKDIRDLECAAIWESNHIIERLISYFHGKPSINNECLRPWWEIYKDYKWNSDLQSDELEKKVRELLAIGDKDLTSYNLKKIEEVQKDLDKEFKQLTYESILYDFKKIKELGNSSELVKEAIKYYESKC